MLGVCCVSHVSSLSDVLGHKSTLVENTKRAGGVAGYVFTHGMVVDPCLKRLVDNSYREQVAFSCRAVLFRQFLSALLSVTIDFAQPWAVPAGAQWSMLVSLLVGSLRRTSLLLQLVCAIAQQLFGGLPAQAAVGDGDAVPQVAAQGLAPLEKMAFKHHANQ